MFVVLSFVCLYVYCFFIYKIWIIFSIIACAVIGFIVIFTMKNAKNLISCFGSSESLISFIAELLSIILCLLFCVLFVYMSTAFLFIKFG